MQHFQAFQYALMPTGEQQRQMRRFAGSCRFVFNKALALQKERYEREVEPPVPQATSAIGIDMSVARFATLSDGTFLEPLSSFKKHEARLSRYQRAMSRKTKFSKNWHKAKRGVQNIHTLISNARCDFLHKATATTSISQNHAFVCIEGLQVRNMPRSAAGTVEKPGRNVRAKSGLNKSILDQGWFEFRRQMDYKLAWNGGWLSPCRRRTRAGRVRSVVV